MTDKPQPAGTPAQQGRFRLRPSRDTLRRLLLAAAGYLFDLVFPSLVGLAAWYLISDRLGLYRQGRVVQAVLFLLIFLMVSAAIYAVLRSFLNWRKRVLKPGGKPFRDSQPRRFRDIALFGLLVPIAVAVAAMTVPVSSGRSYVALLRDREKGRPEESFINAVADAALASSSMQVKLQAVETLAAVPASESLSELLRMIESDPAALYDAAYADTLGEAISAHGVAARDPLLALWHQLEADLRPSSAVAPDLYEAHFRRSVDALRAQIIGTAADSDALAGMRLTVDELEAQLRRSLDRLEETGTLSLDADPRPALVLETLARIDALAADREVQELARSVAADPGCSASVRAGAARLLAAVGSRADQELLVDLLDEADEGLRAAALEAIRALELRQSGTTDG